MPCLATVLCNNEPCAPQHEVISGQYSSERTCRDHAEEECVCMWEALQCSFFRKKTIDLSGAKWRRNFFKLFSLDTVEKEFDKAKFLTSKKCSVLDVLDDPSKKILNKRDPIYSGFGKLRNGFYVSSNGLVFSSEIEVHNFQYDNYDVI